MGEGKYEKVGAVATCMLQILFAVRASTMGGIDDPTENVRVDEDGLSFTIRFIKGWYKGWKLGKQETTGLELPIDRGDPSYRRSHRCSRGGDWCSVPDRSQVYEGRGVQGGATSGNRGEIVCSSPDPSTGTTASRCYDSSSAARRWRGCELCRSVRVREGAAGRDAGRARRAAGRAEGGASGVRGGKAAATNSRADSPAGADASPGGGLGGAGRGTAGAAWRQLPFQAATDCHCGWLSFFTAVGVCTVILLP